MKNMDDEDTQEGSIIEGEEIDLDEEMADLEQKKTSMFHLVWIRFKRNKLAIFGISVVFVMMMAAILAPIITPYGPQEASYQEKLEGPTWDHPLGTDQMGRDIYTRLVYGTRIALFIGVVMVGLSGGIGVAAGLAAGAAGGVVDEIIMRVVDTFLSFPVLVMAFAIAGIMGMGMWPVIIAVSIIIWTRFARVVRGEILSLKQELFIEAAESIGESRLSIMFRYFLPNVLPSVMVVATLQIPAALLYNAALSFLGVGVQPPTPDWGLMVSFGRRYLLVSPWMSTFGGLAIMLTVLGFSFMGDGLRDALDPMTGGE